jgi:hypothetical protein
MVKGAMLKRIARARRRTAVERRFRLPLIS